MTLDDLRDAHPELGFALYAYRPGEPVTLEVLDGEQSTYTFVGTTAEAAIAKAFPDLVTIQDNGDLNARDAAERHYTFFEMPDETPEEEEDLFA